MSIAVQLPRNIAIRPEDCRRLAAPAPQAAPARHIRPSKILQYKASARRWLRIRQPRHVKRLTSGIRRIVCKARLPAHRNTKHQLVEDRATSPLAPARRKSPELTAVRAVHPLAQNATLKQHMIQPNLAAFFRHRFRHRP